MSRVFSPNPCRCACKVSGTVGVETQEETDPSPLSFLLQWAVLCDKVMLACHFPLQIWLSCRDKTDSFFEGREILPPLSKSPEQGNLIITSWFNSNLFLLLLSYRTRGSPQGDYGK